MDNKFALVEEGVAQALITVSERLYGNCWLSAYMFCRPFFGDDADARYWVKHYMVSKEEESLFDKFADYVCRIQSQMLAQRKQQKENQDG